MRSGLKRKRDQHLIRAVVLIFALVVASLGSTTRGAESVAIAQARQLLYTDRNRALTILEDALRRSPDDIRCWCDYINALHIDRFQQFAERASLHALRLHPENADLYIARARILDFGASLDVLAELQKLKGHERQAQRLSEFPRHSLFLPEPNVDDWSADDYEILINRLLILGQRERADQYLREGLARYGADENKPLLACKAMMLAMDGQYDEAVALYVSIAPVEVGQVGNSSPYDGLPDLLLLKEKPRLAIACFEKQPPAKDDDESRRILAMCKARVKDTEGAIELLASDSWWDKLLLVRVLLMAGREDDARKAAEKFIRPLQLVGGAYGGPLLWDYGGPISLAEDYLATVRWIHGQFPEKRTEIEHYLGTGKEKSSRKLVGWSVIVPNSEQIAQLGRQLKTAPNDTEVRRFLARSYAESGRYAEAAGVLEPLIGLADAQHVFGDALDWAIYVRRAEAERASEKNFWALASARSHIVKLRMALRKHEDTKAEEAALVKIGPAALADVFTGLGYNVISKDDRRPWASIIGSIGSEQDVPVLIGALRNLTTSDHDPDSAKAVDECLEKLTSARAQGADMDERLVWWTKWWVSHAGEILAKQRQTAVSGQGRRRGEGGG